jgi:peroxiredoxin
MKPDGSWPYPKPVAGGEARHLVSGLRLPDIVLQATTGADVNLAQLTGRAVIFCYPWMGNPGLANPPGWDDIAGAHGSTPQAEAYRDQFAAFQRLGVVVCGLSQQAAAEQLAASRRLRLPFALLSDAEGAFQKQMKLPQFSDDKAQRYLCRLTMLVEDGLLKRVWYPVHPPPADAHTVLKCLR